MIIALPPLSISVANWNQASYKSCLVTIGKPFVMSRALTTPDTKHSQRKLTVGVIFCIQKFYRITKRILILVVC